MLSMSHINNIRDLRKKGSTIKEIAEITHTDPKTVRKYLNQEDFSPQRPVNPERPSILDPFKPIIQKWLDEDKKNWRKQQFTAMRIYHLLQEQEGFTGSYNVVQRYVKKVKKREKERRNLELISAWAIGIQDEVKETELFARFHAQYNFLCRFCSPRAGHEKGNVENKVRYIRNNLFVPVLEFDDWDEFNRQLLQSHEKQAAEIHYKKQKLISDLFQEDLDACYSLPSHPFDVCRYVVRKADGYGKICIDGKHWYSTRPELAKQQILIGLRANFVDILDYETGELITRHARQYGNTRTDTYDYSTTLAMLIKNCGAWQNSGLRKELPDGLRKELDQQAHPQLRSSLRILDHLTQSYGWQAALEAIEKVLQQGSLNPVDTEVLAGRIAGYGIQTPPEPGPTLEVYDEIFLKGAMEHADGGPETLPVLHLG